ncbi:MAG: hypothetical protein GFH27_549279n62 [Chloroflexi bacterium AL-W]|nr:hypothetical protein [Chloroflexi bacterium AL-N1]NOK71073.1 hypothetical protein [Chloroflexi bacterium AL-N10]NOK72705.1 hypothetical protein [Chloroflexi bacterium AL-N5]NOK79207.1 hypothetical protein [Chloroflexi bacterium AL-W]NOK87123.1 hypothetical protein [Chloroflexi bacterium AL-N15]
MNDEKKQNQNAQQSNDQSKDTPDLMNELREMGQQFEALFRAAVENDRTKQLRRDLSGGVRELTSQVRDAVKTVQSNPQIQQAEERGRQAFNQAQQSKVANDVQETMVAGIAQLNAQLRKLVGRVEPDSDKQTPPTSDSQDPPQGPVTGPTTKLD